MKLQDLFSLKNNNIKNGRLLQILLGTLRVNRNIKPSESTLNFKPYYSLRLFSRGQIDDIFFSFFFQKIGFDI